MTREEIKVLFKDIPRKPIAFLPTPFHKLENLSERYDVNLYFKREDMSGPSNFGGQKIRKLEFIMGEALKENVEYIISMGGYQSNSAMELAAACIHCGIKPILFLDDIKDQGIPEDIKGNLLLDKLMGAEIHFVLRDPDETDYLMSLQRKMERMAAERKKELEAEGHKVMYVDSGCVHRSSYVSHVLTFLEILEQAEQAGTKVDYIFHTSGTGGTLPGLLAAKLMLKSDVKIVSVTVNPYVEGSFCNPRMLCERVHCIFEQLNLPCPPDEEIYEAMNIEQGFIGEEYGIPSIEGTNAIRELAQTEAMFVDPVYTGKGFAGLLHYIKTHKIPAGSNVVFIHTGGTGALFAEKELAGNLVE